jgi:hypothetical protein
MRSADEGQRHRCHDDSEDKRFRQELLVRLALEVVATDRVK